ncbi:glycosyltransferase family 61 protein [Hymenobacter sp. HSC-4F20]|uniref:glycosyltransferase family 61 protein n=1 Tax=Hymenobacter sp. HSC-4F20 TaxID=2864135 RepID=UPI001C73D498|nr:glycosyltransferase family 61 protein [Hymenobacter sp. HSC-4F20]MBX0292130.1 glycosyltransferase family 61 protein [Hymenobacter sp. HSC-4F20]
MLKKVIDFSIAKLSKVLPAWEATTVVNTFPEVPAHRYTLPGNIGSMPEEVAAHYQKMADEAPTTLPALHLYTIANANVSWHGAMFNNFRLFKPEMSPDVDVFFRDSFLLKQWLQQNKVRRYDEAALVYDIWSAQNYYHWLVESLPRLLALRKYYPNISLLVPDPTPSFIKVTTSLLGFEKLIPIKKDEIARVKSLLVPEKVPYLVMSLEDTTAGQGDFSLTTVRNELLRALDKPNRLPHRRIYVSRAKQAVRRVSNEVAVEQVLKKHGFETVFFEDLSFKEQMALMQETAVLVGLHGANLTNLMFLQPTAKVIELINLDSEKYLFYFFLASYFNISYYASTCRSATGDVNNQVDVVVDTAELDSVLLSALSE